MKTISLKFKKFQQGISLLELTVATGVFVIVTLMVNGIYINIVNYQRQSMSSQVTQESLRFAIETMGKELRTAQGLYAGSDCGALKPVSGHFKIFNNISNDGVEMSTALYFKNVYGQCVVYDLVDDRLRIKRDASEGYITPNELNIISLKFVNNDTVANVDVTFQPSITIMVEAEMNNGPKMNLRMQTTVSSREYTY
ncbi:hypothetical protein L6270_04745 [Candidatus Parcubacteria bacterium]|nr:hypothetical protein [Patescibacteria group bacterium]MBU4309269.1 hypothetical protein [Patescibacteria group bacterium]MBU4432498.1 hypothetical protein [Patescibacteria group bacterium]MBU4577630.1 hypothetical protein [Patescibacteria group bacterium]MCG2697316.1 hypothetical protein [Candidatus Parcubacteria bacterium]